MNSGTHHPLQKTIGHYSHDNTAVPYCIWHKPGNSATSLVVFLGSVQIGLLAQWVAETCPPNSFVIEGAPHWLAGDSDDAVADFMFHYTQETFRVVRSLQTSDSVDVITESQAVPGVIEIFTQDDSRPALRSLRLIQPLELNYATYAGADSERMAIFQRRLRRNLVHQIPAILTDSKLRYNHRLLYGAIRKQHQKHLKQYSSGLHYDALPSLAKLYGLQQNIVIFCGAKDAIFPVTEIQESLASHELGIDLRAVEGVPHSPLATKYGQKLLAAAIESL